MGLLKGLAKMAVAGLVARRVRRARDADTSSGPSPARGSATAATPAPSAGPQQSDRAGEIPTQRAREAGPDSPLELEPQDWKATAKRTLKEIKEDRVTFAAAAMAYYFFLAIFPALIAVVGIMGLANIDAKGLVDTLRENLPGGAGEALTSAVANADETSQAASLVATIAGLAVALWSASSGMAALQTGLNVAYDVPRERKFIKKRAVAFVLLLAMFLLGGVPSPIFSFGESTFFQILGWLLTVAAVILLFSIFYYLGPNRESPTWQWVSAGGVVGALLWIAASLIFGFYIANFNNYGKTYGPLAGVVVLVLWLYLSSIAVLVGGELNAELERQAEKQHR